MWCVSTGCGRARAGSRGWYCSIGSRCRASSSWTASSLPPAAAAGGIGTMLIEAMFDLARSQAMDRVRLGVVDTNLGAHRLYERMGFEATKTERLPLLGKRLGFRSSTEMVRRV
ncbi:MAG: GNAT family N-acetyltransferase [Acidimicrobiia bacterium]